MKIDEYKKISDNVQVPDVVWEGYQNAIKQIKMEKETDKNIVKISKWKNIKELENNQQHILSKATNILWIVGSDSYSWNHQLCFLIKSLGMLSCQAYLFLSDLIKNLHTKSDKKYSEESLIAYNNVGSLSSKLYSKSEIKKSWKGFSSSDIIFSKPSNKYNVVKRC